LLPSSRAERFKPATYLTAGAAIERKNLVSGWDDFDGDFLNLLFRLFNLLGALLSQCRIGAPPGVITPKVE